MPRTIVQFLKAYPRSERFSMAFAMPWPMILLIGFSVPTALQAQSPPNAADPGASAPAENLDAALEDVQQWITEWEERQEAPVGTMDAPSGAAHPELVRPDTTNPDALHPHAANSDSIGLEVLVGHPQSDTAVDEFRTLDGLEQVAAALPPAPAVFWRGPDLAAAYADAAASGKPILVKFTATWCAPCRLLEEQTFSDSTVADYVNGHMIPLALDMESDFDGIALAQYHGVKALPTVLILDAQGGLKERFTGMFGPTAFLERFRGY